MRTLGLDLSLNATGVCVKEGDKILFIDTLKIKKEKGVERLSLIKERITSILNKYQPDTINIEGYSFGSRGRAIFNIGELGGVVRLLLYENGYKFNEISPKTLKKQFTGNGNADKESMLKRANEVSGVVIEDHNQADAFALASA